LVTNALARTVNAAIGAAGAGRWAPARGAEAFMITIRSS
jgi:hypothetical protein